MGDPRRLTPQFRSRKLQALDFIKFYYARCGVSPTLSEIGAELGVSIKRAQELRDRLVQDGSIFFEPGKARGIRLIDPIQEVSQGDAVRQLVAAGWTVGVDHSLISPPNGAPSPFTKRGLPGLPILHHPGPGEPGAGIADGDDIG